MWNTIFVFYYFKILSQYVNEKNFQHFTEFTTLGCLGKKRNTNANYVL